MAMNGPKSDNKMHIEETSEPPTLNKIFCDAAKDNQVEIMRAIHKGKYLGEYSGKNKITSQSVMTALACASLKGHENTFNYAFKLLSFYDLNVQDADGYYTAMYAAAQRGHLKLLKTLMTHYSRRSFTFVEIGNTFCFAFKANQTGVKNYLLANYSNELLAFFPTLCTQNHIDISYYFFEKFSDFLSLERLKSAHNILKHKQEAIEDSFTLAKTKQLCEDIKNTIMRIEEKSASISTPSSSDVEDPVAALHTAARAGEIEKIQFILKQNANQFNHLHIGRTFHIAFESQYQDIMQYLLENYLFEINQFFIENTKNLSPAEIAYGFHYLIKLGLFEEAFPFLHNEAPALTTEDLSQAQNSLKLKILHGEVAATDKQSCQKLNSMIDLILKRRAIILATQQKSEGLLQCYIPSYSNKMRSETRVDPQEHKILRKSYKKSLKADGLSKEAIQGTLAIWDEENPSPSIASRNF